MLTSLWNFISLFSKSYSYFFTGLGNEFGLFVYSDDYIEADPLLVDAFFNILIFAQVVLDIVSCFFKDFSDGASVFWFTLVDLAFWEAPTAI